MATPSLAVQARLCIRTHGGVSLFPRREENRPDVQALRNVRQRYGKIWRRKIFWLVNAGPRIDPVFRGIGKLSHYPPARTK